jgi:site-specific DNA recombinase
MPTTRQPTAAIYARFSSEMQSERSVDDQLAECERFAQRHGYRVPDKFKFSDRAKSGTTQFGRDGFLDMKQAALRRDFDALIVESTSRLARDLEISAGLFKRLEHRGIKILTLHQGEVTALHIGVNGIVDSQYIENLRHAVRRGYNGRVREGYIPGGMFIYGYDRVPDVVSNGVTRFKPGERAINQVQASVIRRIFQEYAAGVSPRAIAARLTKDGIPTPSGMARWRHQVIIGGGFTSILRNPSYIGELHWNRARSVEDPDTGRTQKFRQNPDALIVTKVPHLRIIEQPLWDAVQAILKQRGGSKAGGKVVRRPPLCRSDYLLGGLLKCGTCGSDMIVSNTLKRRDGKPQRFVKCQAAFRHGGCDHAKGYSIDGLQKVVIENFAAKLLDPERVIKAATAWHAEYAALAKKDAVDRISVERQLSRLTVQMDRLVTAISDSDEPLPALLAALKVKEAERAALSERVKQIKATTNVVSLHPKVTEAYRRDITRLADRLCTDPNDVETRMAFKNVVDSIAVHPTPKGAEYELTPYCRIAALFGERFPAKRTNGEIVAAEGFVSTAIAASRTTSDSRYCSDSAEIISLGRWTGRAA